MVNAVFDPMSLDLRFESLLTFETILKVMSRAIFLQR